MSLESEAARSHVTLPLRLPLLLLLLLPLAALAARSLATASASTAADCALCAPSRRIGCLRLVIEAMERVCKRPGKVVWEGTARRVWRREGFDERMEGVRSGGSWERARRVARRATEVLWRVWVGARMGVAVVGGESGWFVVVVLMSMSDGGRVWDNKWAVSGDGRMRSFGVGAGAPILEARVWNVSWTSGGLEES